MPKLELSQIVVKVTFPALLIDAFHAPNEDRELASNSAAMDRAILKVHMFRLAAIACALARAKSYLAP